MDTQPQLLSIHRKPKQQAKPMYSYCVLLANNNTIEVKAHDWSESSGDEGEGIAYMFFVDQKRVLHLEYTEVRAVMCREYTDVDSIKNALCPSTAKRKRPEKTK